MFPYRVMDIIPLIIILLIFIFIFSLIAMNKANSWFNLLKLYFSIISIVGILGTVVAFGTAGYSWLNQFFITDTEYIAGNDSRKIQQCEEPVYSPSPKEAMPVNPTGEPNIRQKTPKEIETCKTKAEQRVILERRLDTKQAIIWGLVRGIIFLLLFLSHYPRMVKQHEEEKKEVIKKQPQKSATKLKKKIAKK